jgi:hypothetical protein
MLKSERLPTSEHQAQQEADFIISHFRLTNTRLGIVLAQRHLRNTNAASRKLSVLVDSEIFSLDHVTDIAWNMNPTHWETVHQSTDLLMPLECRSHVATTAVIARNIANRPEGCDTMP